MGPISPYMFSCYLGICLAQRTKYGARKSLCVFLLLWYLFAGPQYVNLYV